MRDRKSRTEAFRKQIKLEYSIRVLDERVREALEYGDIVTDFFWELLVLNEQFRIEWVGHIDPKKYGHTWNFNKLSDIFQFEIEWVDKYPNENWNWEAISTNYKFTIDWFEKYPDKPWNFSHIGTSIFFDIDWIKQYPEQSWDWKTLSWSYNFQIEWVDMFPDKPWDWSAIVKRPNVSIRWVQKYPDKEWQWENMIYLRMFETWWLKWFPSEWTQERAIELIKQKKEATLKSRPFTKSKSLIPKRKQTEKTRFYERKMREYMAAYKIQQWWYEITLSPSYAIGRKFIAKRYNALFDID